MNFPELPRKYAVKLEADTNLRLLYCCCDGVVPFIHIPPWKLFELCLSIHQNGYIVDLNLGDEGLKRAVLDEYHRQRIDRSTEKIKIVTK